MQKSKTERIDIQTSATVKAVLQQAAASVNKSVSEFLLDSGLSAASEALADRRLFTLDEDKWNQFRALLDHDPKDKPELKRLLIEPSAFE